MSDTFDYPAPRTVAAERPPARLRAWMVVAGVAIGLVLGAAVFARGTGYAFAPASAFESRGGTNVPSDPGELRRLQAALAKQNRQSASLLEKAAPKGNYIVIDQTQNRLYLMNDGKVLHEAVCSAGSGMVLKESGPKARKWVFDTPRGVFKVHQRVENPAWRKPDWAFVEDGKKIPAGDSPDRIEYGTLGEYALYLEDGYMIHGTLYERLLGRNVSHGCVRLGKEDLRVIWKNAPLGTPVYIF